MYGCLFVEHIIDLTLNYCVKYYKSDDLNSFQLTNQNYYYA